MSTIHPRTFNHDNCKYMNILLAIFVQNMDEIEMNAVQVDLALRIPSLV